MNDLISKIILPKYLLVKTTVVDEVPYSFFLVTKTSKRVYENLKDCEIVQSDDLTLHDAIEKKYYTIRSLNEEDYTILYDYTTSDDRTKRQINDAFEKYYAKIAKKISFY